ncbi:tachylectin-related carbohydrate-binding protein, partial [Fischerella muscicola]
MKSLKALAISVILSLWSFPALANPIYAIKSDGDMLFYKHTGTDDGSPTWPIQGVKIGNGWNFKQVFAGDNGAVYAIKSNGDMLFYKHTGTDDGSRTWPISGVKIGNG